MIIKIIFCLILKQTVYPLVSLPIEILPKENYKLSNELNSHRNLMNNEYKSIFFTLFEIGNPIQRVPLLLKPEVSSFIVTSINSLDNCSSYTYRDIFNFSETFFNKNNYNFYDEMKSSSFILNNCDYGRFYECCQQCNTNETFIFYQDINLQKTTKKEKLYFELMRNVEDNITGEIGLNLYDKNKRSFNSFLNILKKRNLIEDYNWYFDFESWDNNKGKVIIGSLPHENYPDNYYYDDLMFAKVISSSFIIYWKMQFDKIYININKNKEDYLYFNETIIEFKFDSNIIIGTYEYEKYILNFFNKYIKEEKCFNDSINDYKLYSNKLKFYYCKIDSNIKKELYESLPKIYLYSNEFNYTFEIENKDLLKIENEYIYYRVLFRENKNSIWYLGKPFSLKYKFIFNPEKKQIGFYRKFYNKKENENNSSNSINYSYIIKIIIIILLSILILFLGIQIGKFINENKRKKRANELNDEYNYISNEINNNNDNKNIIND